jgi:putative peptide zinc metalloprotease protein
MNDAQSDCRLRFRRDLVCQPMTMGDRMVWVLKDPLAQEIHYVSDDEYRILSLADGARSVQEIFRQCSRVFTSHFIAPEALVHFLADAKRKRLLVDSATPSVTASPSEKPIAGDGTTDRRWWSNLFAIRLPGLQPNRILSPIVDRLGWLFTPSLAIAYVLFVIVASLIVLVYWPSFQEGVAAAFAQRSSQTLAQLLVVTSLVKVVHELAHAVTCRRLGGNCREIGVMLLLGVPTLYCDVSDAWLLPQRYKRILISAAGILAELAIASFATVLWLFSADPVLSQWCMIVMVVCSINTLLVNGNPLMRYDGYFILSDLVGVPNLATRASFAMRSLVRRCLWNERTPSRLNDDAHQLPWLALYALLSLCYRVSVFVALGWLAFRFMASHQVAIIGILLGLSIAATSCFAELRAILSPPSVKTVRSDRARLQRWPVGAGLLAILCMLLPLPRTLVAPFTIRPTDEKAIFATSAGRIRTFVNEGKQVRIGEPIAETENWALKDEMLRAESLQQSLSTQRSSLVSLRQSKPEIAAGLLATIQAEASATERLALIRKEVDQLFITAPMDGMVFGQPWTLSTLQAAAPVPMSSSLLESSNEGASVTAGMPICTIGHESRREAIVLIDQKRASLVREGQRVTLLLVGVSLGACEGTIIELGAAPIEQIPPELLAAGLVLDESQPSSANDARAPQKEHYQLRVKLDNVESRLPVRLTGQARIEIDSASILERVVRWTLQSLSS